ncbi:flavin reductase (DIM6/NTAB) family NADH-FMN oxidoreductase RutF [Bradyrhizobium elkanii]|uniref:flavin reductase family protein n=1 Tax=Bradyrhizobium elkanii TaxID=29448 RepID=UPI0035136A61
MFYETEKNNHGLRHNPMKALVVPRPIGWISTMSAKGEVNLSPYSFFNILSVRPDIVGFSSEGRKDALSFAEETKEFVCNLATWDLRNPMHETAAPVPRGENEMMQAGLEAVASTLVAPPRVKDSPVALECKWLRTLPLNPLDGGDARYVLVLGQVVGVHIDDRYIKDGMVDSAAMKPIARAGYDEYFVSDGTAKFSIPRNDYARA